MPSHVWQPLLPADPAAWEPARNELHHALQPLASFAAVHLEPLKEDRHRSLCWETGCGGFVTGSPADHPDLRVELGLSPLELRVRCCDGLDTLELRGSTLAQAREWLRERLLERLGVDRELPAPEYTIPDHPVADGVPFDPDASCAELLSRWFHDGALSLIGLSTVVDVPHNGVRTWPHHFDMALLLEAGHRPDGTRCTVGVGLSPGDGGHAAPYWYVTPYPYDFDASRTELSFGRWNTDGWLGIVLGADELLEVTDAAGQAARLRAFLDEAVAAARSTLGLPETTNPPDDLDLRGRSRPGG